MSSCPSSPWRVYQSVFFKTRNRWSQKRAAGELGSKMIILIIKGGPSHCDLG